MVVTQCSGQQVLNVKRQRKWHKGCPDNSDAIDHNVARQRCAIERVGRCGFDAGPGQNDDFMSGRCAGFSQRVNVASQPPWTSGGTPMTDAGPAFAST